MLSSTYEEYVKLVEDANHALATTRKEEGDDLIREYGSLPSALSREQWELIFKK